LLCAGLANSEHSHPAGHLLKTSILLQHDSDNERLTIGTLPSHLATLLLWQCHSELEAQNVLRLHIVILTEVCTVCGVFSALVKASDF